MWRVGAVLALKKKGNGFPPGQVGGWYWQRLWQHQSLFATILFYKALWARLVCIA